MSGGPNPSAGARLARMRLMATGLLAAMALVYALASYAERRWSGAAFVRAFAEAAMVGGVADWFAVTALFRRPLGLPIPHTAVIPRSKARIGAALGRFIVDNFLSARVLDAKLRELEVATWGGDWLRRPANARKVAERLVGLGPDLVRALPDGALEEIMAAIALAAARATPAAPAASALLSAAWGEGRAAPLIDRGAELLSGYLADHQDIILEKVQGQSWRWLPTWVDRAIARKITAGLVQLLSDLRAPDHPWRVSLGATVETWIGRLAEDPELRARGEALKAQFLASPRLAQEAGRLFGEVRRRLQADGSASSGFIADRLEVLLASFGAWLSTDQAVQRVLNVSARSMARKVLAPRLEAVGRFVAQVVDGWDARDVVERLELQVGPDLQYIRVSGTLVGGLVGLALFTASRLAGLG